MGERGGCENGNLKTGVYFARNGKEDGSENSRPLGAVRARSHTYKHTVPIGLAWLAGERGYTPTWGLYTPASMTMSLPVAPLFFQS